MLKIIPSSYEAGARLRSFILDGRKLVVDEVIDQWHDAKYEYLKLLADDQKIYVLRRGEGNHWYLEMVYSF